MFIGHFAAGLAAKKLAPKTSLGTLFMASQFIDLLWPLLLIAGLERAEINPAHKVTPIDFTHYPFSHSLLFVFLWAVLFGGLHYFFRREKRSALVLGGLVLSHWFLDLIVHRPDLGLLPQGPFVGLGLWESLVATMFVESLLFFAGVFLYYKVTSPINKKGSYATAFLIFLLISIHVGNMFGPPPPSIMMVAYAGNLTWLFVWLAYFADKNRH